MYKNNSNTKIKKTLLTLCLACSPIFVYAEPKFDCTALETHQYIEQVTYNSFAPSPLSPPAQFKEAFIQREMEAAKAGDAAAKTCLTIFSDGKLLDEWKGAIDDIRNLNIDISFSGFDGAALMALLKKARDMAEKELLSALDKLGEDICKLMSTDHLKSVLLSTVNAKFGTKARNLRVADFAAIVQKEALDNASDNVKLLLSPDDLEDRINSEARSNIRQQRRELWNKF